MNYGQLRYPNDLVAESITFAKAEPEQWYFFIWMNPTKESPCKIMNIKALATSIYYVFDDFSTK